MTSALLRPIGRITWNDARGRARSMILRRSYFTSSTKRSTYTFRFGVNMGRFVELANLDIRSFQPEDFASKSAFSK